MPLSGENKKAMSIDKNNRADGTRTRTPGQRDTIEAPIISPARKQGPSLMPYLQPTIAVRWIIVALSGGVLATEALTLLALIYQQKRRDAMTTGDFALVISIINSVLILAVLMEG